MRNEAPGRQLHTHRGAARAALVLTLLISGTGFANAQSGPPGIVRPQVFAAFDPSAPACARPPGFKNVLGFSQDNRREFIEGVAHGLAMAARDRNLEYRTEIADNDAAKQSAQVRQLHADGVGAIVTAPVDARTLAPSLQEVLWSGGYVGAVVPPPATEILNAPQYLTGKTLGLAAASYINVKLGGHAKVVLLTQDSLEFLAPRFAALRDVMDDMPGVTVVADISPNPVTKDGGFATMKTILTVHPDVDVVLGSDTVVLGALAALREAGKARPEQFLGGIDGEPEAIAEIKNGGNPYKISVGLASPVFGYALGQHAADWLEGKSIPKAIDILPSALSSTNIAEYEADLADPARVYADSTRRAAYLKMYGNICYDTRDQYVNFPWSSEHR